MLNLPPKTIKEKCRNSNIYNFFRLCILCFILGLTHFQSFAQMPKYGVVLKTTMRTTCLEKNIKSSVEFWSKDYLEDILLIYDWMYTCNGEVKNFSKSLAQENIHPMSHVVVKETYAIDDPRNPYTYTHRWEIEELLYKPARIISNRIQYDISIFPDVNFSVLPLPITEYSSRNKVFLKANSSDFIYPTEAYAWEYKIGNGPIREYPVRGAEIKVGLIDLPLAQIGDNIYFRLKSRQSASDFVVFRFYAALPMPRPLPANTQYIKSGETNLTTLEITFNRNLNPALEERINTISIYDSLAQFDYNGMKIPEARIIAQFSNLHIESLTNDSYSIDLISHGIYLTEGKYYISAEGTVRQKSSNLEASHNSVFTSTEAKTAMFTLQEFKIEKLRIKTTEFQVQPPLCNNGTASFYIEMEDSDMFRPTTFTFYKNGIQWQADSMTTRMVTSFPVRKYKGYIFNEIPPGTYTIKVVYSGVPLRDMFFVLDIPNPLPMEIDLKKADISGIQYKNGVAESSKDGWLYLQKNQTRNGTPPYNYTYSINGINKGRIFDTVKIPVPTSYSIQLIDAHKCEAQFTGTIVQLKDTLKVTLSGTDPKCNTSNDGFLTTSLNKVNSVDFTWIKNSIACGENIPVLEGLGEGSYKVIAQSRTSRLQSYDTYILKNPSPLKISSSLVNVKCKGEKTGAIDISSEGGVPPYSYSWDNGMYGEDLKFVGKGNYTLTMADANACRLQKTFTISEPEEILSAEALLSRPYYKTPTSLEKGAITIHPKGGTAPYTYNWTPPNTMQNLTQLDEGSYHLQITDANQCIFTDSYTLLTVPQIQSKIKTLPPSCHNSKDGILSLEIEGGRTPYTVEWSNGLKGDSLIGLKAGEYTAQITDAFGASALYTMEVKAPEPLVIKNAVLQQITYYGAIQGVVRESLHDGSIQVEVEGGSPPYVYQWYKEDSTGNLEEIGEKHSALSNLSPAKYYLRLTDKQNCNIESEFVIEDRKAFVADIIVEDSVHCFGEKNAILQARITGGTAPYILQWFKKEDVKWENRGERCADVSTGSYTLIATDAQGIQSTSEISMKEPEILQMEYKSVKEPDYYGSVDGTVLPCLENGRILLNPKGGNGNYTYQWSHQAYAEIGSEGMIMQNLKGGTYIVKIKDKRNCRIEDTTILRAYTSLLSEIQEINSISCHGGNEGVLQVKVSGGKPPYTYEWSNFSNEISISELPSSYYVVGVTDANGIKSSYTYFLAQAEKLLSSIHKEASLCAGDFTGSMSIEASGGTPPYTYLWSNGSTAKKIEGLETANLQVEVSDVKGCKSSTNARLLPPDPLRLYADTVNPSYKGVLYQTSPIPSSDGLIELYASGGIQPYSYAWERGDTSATLQNMKEGIYVVNLKDANNCSLQKSFHLRSLPNLHASLSLTKEIRCFGDADAVLNIQTEGGLPPYTFQWQDLANTQDTLMQARAGIYKIAVTDKNGIISLDSLCIDQPKPLDLSLKVDSVSAWGASDGSLFAICEGGTSPYTYQWSTGDTVSFVKDLKAGRYSLKLTDNNDCTLSKEVEIYSPDSLTHTFTLKHCTYFGAVNGNAAAALDDGQIEVFVKGGVPPYTYTWMDSLSQTNRIENLTNAYYWVEIKDKNAHTIRDTFYIHKMPSLCASVEAISQIHCMNDSNGQLSAKVEGGIPPYRFTWSNGETDSILSSLIAGRYILGVEDAKGVSSTFAYILEQPDSLRLNLIADSTLGFGRCDGKARVEISGGSPPYSCLWSNTKSETMIDGLCMGSYAVLVQDTFACQVYKEVEVYSPSPLRVQAEIKHCDYFGAENNVSKESLNNGFIKLFAEGACPPYDYIWESGHRQAAIFNLPDNLYKVKVVDKNGNYILDSFRIEKPGPLIVDIQIEKSLKCYGDSSGELRATVSGGRPPYRILWNDGSSEDRIIHAKSAWYELKVYDSLGVLSTRKLHLDQANIFKVYASADSLTGIDRKDGVLNAWAEGGTPPYKYTWRNEELSFEGVQWRHLSQGLYNLHASDANACTDSLSILVSAPALLDLDVNLQHCTYSGSKQMQADTLYNDGSIYVQARGGTPPYSYYWNDGDTNNERKNLSPATYLVSVSDAYDNKLSRLMEIKRTNFLRSQIILEKIPDCAASSDGILKAEGEGGIKPYTFEWFFRQDTGESTPMYSVGNKEYLYDRKSGYYLLKLTDSLGVEAFYEYYMQDLPILQVQTNLYEPTCHSFDNGKIVLTAKGGTPPYTYTWKDNAEGAVLANVKRGNYIFEVKDAKKCVHRDSVQMKEPKPIVIRKHIDSPLCYGAEGEIRIEAEGGKPPYRYQWKGFAGDSIVRNAKAATYVFKLIDSNKCMYEEEIEVVEPKPLHSRKTIKPPLCHGGSDASLKIDMEGGTKPYAYSWEDGRDTDSIYGLTQGIYNVKIVDANLCTLHDTIYVYQPAQLSIQKDVYPISCHGIEDGSIRLQAFGGYPPYKYTWSSGDSLSHLLNLPPDCYRIKIEDANACIYHDSIYIEKVDSLFGSSKIYPHTYTGNITFTEGIQHKDAKIYVELQGGRQPYIYQWSSGENTDSLVHVSHGKYSLYVTDASGCKWMEEFEVKETLPLRARIEVLQAIRCNGDTNAVCFANVKGGIPPYKIEWNTGSKNTKIDNLSKGLYILKVRDSFGVTAIDSLYLREPQPPKITYTIQMPTCHDQADAFIHAQIEGGSFPYALQWNTGQQTNKISNIKAGIYSLCVLDKNHCTYRDTILVEQREKLQVFLEAKSPLCATETGSIWMSAEGGVSPYEFMWQDKAFNHREIGLSHRIENIFGGIYPLQIKDQNGCKRDTQLVLKNPPSLYLTLKDSTIFCVDKYAELAPEIKYVFGEYAYAESEWMSTYADSLVYIWTFPKGEMLSQKIIQAKDTGIYSLKLIEYGGCVQSDSTKVFASLDSISSDFWISTQVEKNDIVLAVNVSSPKADSIVWLLPPQVQLIKTEGEYIELQFTDTGVYEIVLHSYRNNCFESKHTAVRVSESILNYGGGKTNSVFSKLSLTPNPSSDESKLSLTLQNETILNCRLIEVASGKEIYTNRFYPQKQVEFNHVFRQEIFGKGLYILVLESEKEIKILKIVRI